MMTRSNLIRLDQFRTVPVYVALLMIVFAAESAVVITSSGILDAKMLSGKVLVDQESSKNSYTATVTTDGRWALAVYPIHDKGNLLYGTTNIIYMSFDGSDTFYCEYTEAVVEFKGGRPTIVGTKPIAERRLQSYVSSGNYPFSPFDSQRRAHVLWLIYGLGYATHESGVSSVPLPWHPARRTPLAYGYRTDCTLSDSAPFFPHAIKFIRDSKFDLQKEEDEILRPEMDDFVDVSSISSRKEDLRIRKLKWVDGEVAGSLVVETWTNTGKVDVPTAIQIKTFASLGRLRRQYQATVTNVVIENERSMSSEEFRPPVMTKLLVSDSRFRLRESDKNIDFINYKLENDQQWPSAQDPELTNLFAAYGSSANFSARKAGPHHMISAKSVVLLVLLGTLAVWPIVGLRKFLSYTKRRG